jgi:hypothetical protein
MCGGLRLTFFSTLALIEDVRKLDWTADVFASNIYNHGGLAMIKKHFAVFIVIIGIASTSLVGISPGQEQKQPDQIRKVRHDPSKTIESQLLLNDKQLVVQGTIDPPLLVPPPPNLSLAAWLTQLTDAVYIIRVVSLEPALTDNGDWITTKVRAQISDVLKQDNVGFYSSKKMISFNVQGGEISIRGKRVSAVLKWASPFQIGQEYLIFARIDYADNSVHVGPSSVYQMQGSSFKSLRKDCPPDQIEVTAGHIVIDNIRQKAKERK